MAPTKALDTGVRRRAEPANDANAALAAYAAEDRPPVWCAPLERVVSVRGSLIGGSVEALRRRGHFDRYIEQLPERSREPVLNTLATNWVDIEHAVAHYATLQSLTLPEHEVLRIGEAVGARVQSTLLATLGRRAREVGIAPWIFLRNAERVWGRLMNGGRVTMRELGPKQASLRMEGVPLARFSYFRLGFEAVMLEGASLVARCCEVKQMPSRGNEEEFAVSISWA